MHADVVERRHHLAVEVRDGTVEEGNCRQRTTAPADDELVVDAVIQPRDTRKKLIQALEMLETKRDKNPPKKHGNLPL